MVIELHAASDDSVKFEPLEGNWSRVPGDTAFSKKNTCKGNLPRCLILLCVDLGQIKDRPRKPAVRKSVGRLANAIANANVNANANAGLPTRNYEKL